MNTNSEIIIILCSHLCVGEGVYPLEPKEWSDIAKLLLNKNMQPNVMAKFSNDDFKTYLNLDNSFIERIKRLFDRSASLFFEISKYNNIGIKVVTRADKEYPIKLKKVLSSLCPPLFYFAGDINILNDKFIGFVGSRSISDNDISFAKEMTVKSINKGFSVVSGGAKGIDSIVSLTALANKGVAVEFLSDSLLKRIRQIEIIKSIQDNRCALLSASNPNSGFNVGMAMSRNKYIYALSDATVIVKSDFNKGGTWAGAVESLRHQWTKIFCWDNKKYKGNKALIEKGAIPVDADWPVNLDYNTIAGKNVQPNLFDL